MASDRNVSRRMSRCALLKIYNNYDPQSLEAQSFLGVCIALSVSRKSPLCYGYYSRHIMTQVYLFRVTARG